MTSRSGSGPRASRAASVSPWTYSMTRNGVSFSRLTSCSAQMCGWFSEATKRASRSRLVRSSTRRERAAQNLDRDRAVEPRVARPIDLAHAALADRRSDFIWAELGTGRQGHSGLKRGPACH